MDMRTFVSPPIIISFIVFIISLLGLKLLETHDFSWIFFDILILLCASFINTLFILILHVTGIFPYLFLNKTGIIIESLCIVIIYLTLGYFSDWRYILLVFCFIGLIICISVDNYKNSYNKIKSEPRKCMFTSPKYQVKARKALIQSFVALIVSIILMIFLCIFSLTD